MTKTIRVSQMAIIAIFFKVNMVLADTWTMGSLSSDNTTGAIGTGNYYYTSGPPFPGDIINTGTPEGVGMGFKPEKYLRAGQTVVTGIEGIGQFTNKTVAHS